MPIAESVISIVVSLVAVHVLGTPSGSLNGILKEIPSVFFLDF